jgi:predicted transcriptional regulator
MSTFRGVPTDAELAILRVLWRRGPSTVHEVHGDLYQGTGVGYTTSLKLLQNMLTKGLATRDERTRQHVYAAAVPQERTLNLLVRAWIDRTFAGSSGALAMQALGAKPASLEELSRLKQLIKKIEGRKSRD